ncbi:MAG: hypothetical protein LBS60_11975 [Deltaproteobacteria bacterium]|nr:hypothetical protein [Deltaproteobacteria bacterium]
MFKGDEVLKKVFGLIRRGEDPRLALTKISLTPRNVLILAEPQPAT